MLFQYNTLPDNASVRVCSKRADKAIRNEPKGGQSGECKEKYCPIERFPTQRRGEQVKVKNERS
jgi:hypothetical protein